MGRIPTRKKLCRICRRWFLPDVRRLKVCSNRSFGYSLESSRLLVESKKARA